MGSRQYPGDADMHDSERASVSSSSPDFTRRQAPLPSASHQHSNRAVNSPMVATERNWGGNVNQRSNNANVPRPPIAVLGNVGGSDRDIRDDPSLAASSSSRRGSIVMTPHGIPPQHPPQIRRPSISGQHQQHLMPSSAAAYRRTDSHSPPQSAPHGYNAPRAPPAGAPGSSRSPQPPHNVEGTRHQASPHLRAGTGASPKVLSRASSRESFYPAGGSAAGMQTRSSPAAGVQNRTPRGSPLPGHGAQHRSPYAQPSRLSQAHNSPPRLVNVANDRAADR